MDNTCKDNKNRHMFAFAAWLVHTKVFTKVKISCLAVGHTHEDVDRLFSRLSAYFSSFRHGAIQGAKRWCLETLAQLKSCIVAAHTPAPTVQVLEEVWDWRSFFSPITKYSTINGTMSNRAFSFQLNEVGHVTMGYRPFTYPPPEFKNLAAESSFAWDGSLTNIPYFGPITIHGVHVVGQGTSLKRLPRRHIDVPAVQASMTQIHAASGISDTGFRELLTELNELQQQYEMELKATECPTCTEIVQALRDITIHRSDKDVVDEKGRKVNPAKQLRRDTLNERSLSATSASL